MLMAVCVFGFATSDASAFIPPKGKNVHIELVYDVAAKENDVGSSYYFSVVPYSYFLLNDIYSPDERKVGSSAYRDNITALDFMLNHPLYDELIPNGNVRIPFYVEPGDTLMIYVTRVGQVIDYARKDGSRVKHENLLRHDISNRTFYTREDFEKDRKDADFRLFTERVVKRMNAAVDSVESVARRFSFDDEERRIAVNNTKLQFAFWLFEYPQFKSGELSTYSSKHKGGWQSLPEQDREMEAINDVRNYAFVKNLPLSDSTCLASRYFPYFIQSYEHAHIFNSDQYLYYGTSPSAIAKMDSAFMKKEQAITGHMRPSLFMDIAMQRRHYEPLPDDGSIRLDEVQVVGRWNTGYFKGVNERDMLNFRLNSKPTYNALSPSYWLYDRKRIKNKERAKALIKKIEEEEEREQRERDAIMKAYEEVQEEMKEKR